MIFCLSSNNATRQKQHATRQKQQRRARGRYRGSLWRRRTLPCLAPCRRPWLRPPVGSATAAEAAAGATIWWLAPGRSPRAAAGAAGATAATPAKTATRQMCPRLLSFRGTLPSLRTRRMSPRMRPRALHPGRMQRENLVAPGGLRLPPPSP